MNGAKIDKSLHESLSKFTNYVNYLQIFLEKPFLFTNS